MLKKPVVGILFGLSMLSVATAALAQDNSYYAPAPIPVATVNPNYYVVNQGFVIGIQGGYADTHWDNINFDDFSLTHTGFAARLYAGYDFSSYFGMELGAAYLPTATDNFDGEIKNYAIDLLGKLAVPVTSGFSVHAKAGIGYFHSDTDVNLSNEDHDSDDSLTGNSHVGPAFGVGVSYEVIPNLAIGLDWMRYSGQGKIFTGEYQPSPDAVFLGLSYRFPVRYS